MYVLSIHADAEEDLAKIKAADPSAWADICVLLEEIDGDQYLLESLSLEGYEDDRINVSVYVYMQRRRLNIWRLKTGFLEADWMDYRIIYAFDGPRKIYHILAVVHRSFDYERDHETSDRINRAYQGLGLPLLPT